MLQVGETTYFREQDRQCYQVAQSAAATLWLWPTGFLIAVCTAQCCRGAVT